MAKRDLTGSSGLSRLGLSTRSSRNNRWLSYDASRRLQRDALTGIVMVLVAALGLLLMGAFTDSFAVQFVDGVPVAEGKECQLFQVFSPDDPTTPMRPIVDCGDEASIGFSGVIRHVLVAIGAVGVFLLLDRGVLAASLVADATGDVGGPVLCGGHPARHDRLVVGTG